MSAPGKFDYSSNGPDRPLYRSNIATQMERSSSFRETIDHPLPSSHSNMLRSASPITQTDVTKFFQCLRFDPKVVAADHKSIRQGDFKRHVNIALGMAGDESPGGSLKGKLIPSPIPEEIKRLKAGLRENNVKTRERVKIFTEASSVFNKFFPSVPAKKRSRPEGFSGDRTGDRLGLGSGLSKMGIQVQALTGGLELQKSDKRPKSGVPNKRTRTSMMDVRSNAIVRQSAAVDRDKEMMRLGHPNAVPGEDRIPSVGIDGWEKSKMKKRRSCIKNDVSLSLASKRAVDGYRELKQGILQKAAGDSRSRLNGEASALRHGVANGATGFGRSDHLSQQTGLAGRSSLSRVDSDHISLYSEKRERTIGSDKERVNLRAVNKASIHDEFNSSSPTLNTKANASIRGPRSGSGLLPKLSPMVHNTHSPSDWDVSSCTNKPPPLTGVSNCKRMASNRSPSPPVTQWAGQRPQKISRIARRTNLVPIVSSNDEVPSSDNISDVGYSETRFGFPKCSPAASPQQVKLKGENSFSAAALSESEESGPPEIRSRDKGRQPDEIDEKAQNFSKVSVPALHSRKNHKLVTGEELSDGISRQGRTGRGFLSTRSLMPMGVGKLGNVGTAKQLRSARQSFDKTESKAGRPPTRRLSDCKAYKRQKHTAANAAVDLLVGSDDSHEELIAAVNAAINSARNCPHSFWKQMERYFCFISDSHISFLKQQGELSSMGPTPVGTSANFDSREVLPEELVTSRGDSKSAPLYQRLVSALISEDSSSISEELQLHGFGTMNDLGFESEFVGLSHMVEFNDYKSCETLEDEESEDDVSLTPHKGINNSAIHFNGGFSDHSSVNFSEIQYDCLGIDEKIYLEAQSIGIFLEPMPSILNVEDDGISGDIKMLEEAIRVEGLRKKDIINRLLKPSLETKQLQEMEFDQLGYETLVEMAFEKSRASRRYHTSSAKYSSNKISKQAALAFVKRTLERCHQFEGTGKSCFSAPPFKDMLIAGLTQIGDTPADKDSISPVSASAGLQLSSSLTSRMGQTGDSYATSSGMLPLENALLEQTMGKEDSTWSNRIKKRELLLDDVGIGTSLSSSAKGKRSDRDRDGKGQASSRSGTTKIGRPSFSNAKADRKLKTKPKQKTTQISSSVKIWEQQPKSSLSKSSDTTNSNVKDKNKFNLDGLDYSEPLDLSHLQIPDGLGGPDDFDTQAGDLSSWLNIDDDALQDHDLMGLQIPMDDLSDLNMMV